MAKSPLSFNITLGVESAAVKTGLAKVVAEFDQQAGEISKTLAGIKGFAELKQRVDATGAAYQEAAKKASSLAAAVKAPTGDRKTDNQTVKEFERAKIEAGKLKDAYAAQQMELQRLRTSLGQAGVSTKHLSEAQKQLRGNLETAKKEFSALARQAQAREVLGVVPHAEIAAKIGQVRQAYATLASSGKLSLAELAQAKVAMGGKIEELTAQTNGWRSALMEARGGLLEIAAAGVGFGLAVRGAMQFESAMADVRKTVDATPQAFAALRQQVLGLTRDIPLAATELAGIAAAGGQLGIAADDIAEFTALTAKMATAFGMSADEAGQSIGKLKNVFSLGMEEMGSFGDAINQLGNTTAAKEKEIVEVLLRVGGSARQFGLAREQTAALAAAMLSLGKTPEVAATGINALLNRMQTAESQGEDFQAALAAIGTSAEKMAADIQAGPQEAVSGLLESLSMLSGSERANTLTALFGREQQDDIAVLVGGLKAYKEALSQVADTSKFSGAMEKEFAARAATTENQLQLLKNAVSEAGINLGTVFLPAIKAVLTPITALIRVLADMSAAFPKLSAGLFTMGTGFLVFGQLTKLAGILRMAMVSMAGDSVVALQRLPAVLAIIRTEISLTTIKAAGLKGVLGGLGAVAAAGAAGWEIGTWLNKVEIVQKAGIAMAGGLEKAWLRVKLAWAWTTGGDTAEVKRQMEQVDRIYGEMFAEVGRAAKLGAETRTSAEEEVTRKIKSEADKQERVLGELWQKFETRQAAIQKEIATASAEAALAASAEQLALAEAQDLTATKAARSLQLERKERADKLAILDLEIARYKELASLIPGNSPNNAEANAKAEATRQEILQKSLGLQRQRLDLLREGVLAERKAAEEQAASDRKLHEERLRFASAERILAMEEEKLEASRLPTAIARAEAELAIERRISAERIALKKAELDALRSLPGVDPANVMRAEEELNNQKLAASRAELDGERSIARARLAAIEQSWRLGAESVQQYRAAVSAAYRLGLMEEAEFQQRMIASGNDMGAALQLGVRTAMSKMKTDAELMIEIGEGLADRLGDGLGDAFAGVVAGTKSAKEAFRDFAQSTLSWLSQIIMRQMMMKALSSLGVVNADGRIVIPGFASGGRIPGSSPHERADNIPIWATAGEFMQPVNAVRHYGLAFMEAVRTMRFPRDLASAMAGAALPRLTPSFRLAYGGPVPAAAPSYKGGDTRLQVVNVLDKNLLGDYLRTGAGETAIINTIRRNGATIRTILGS